MIGTAALSDELFDERGHAVNSPAGPKRTIVATVSASLGLVLLAVVVVVMSGGADSAGVACTDARALERAVDGERTLLLTSVSSLWSSSRAAFVADGTACIACNKIPFFQLGHLSPFQ